MTRTHITLFAVAAAVALLTPVQAVAADPSGHGGSVVSVQVEPDPGATTPANCGTPNTPPCEA